MRSCSRSKSCTTGTPRTSTLTASSSWNWPDAGSTAKPRSTSSLRWRPSSTPCPKVREASTAKPAGSSLTACHRGTGPPRRIPGRARTVYPGRPLLVCGEHAQSVDDLDAERRAYRLDSSICLWNMLINKLAKILEHIVITLFRPCPPNKWFIAFGSDNRTV